MRRKFCRLMLANRLGIPSENFPVFFGFMPFDEVFKVFKLGFALGEENARKTAPDKSTRPDAN